MPRPVEQQKTRSINQPESHRRESTSCTFRLYFTTISTHDTPFKIFPPERKDLDQQSRHRKGIPTPPYLRKNDSQMHRNVVYTKPQSKPHPRQRRDCSSPGMTTIRIHAGSGRILKLLRHNLRPCKRPDELHPLGPLRISKPSKTRDTTSKKISQQHKIRTSLQS